MLHCGPTVVGCGLEGIVQPTLTTSAVMNNSSKCLAKIPVGFISSSRQTVANSFEKVIIQDIGEESPVLLLRGIRRSAWLSRRRGKGIGRGI
jgi:hypothetical protein